MSILFIKLLLVMVLASAFLDAVYAETDINDGCFGYCTYQCTTDSVETLNGTCNNMAEPLWGSVNHPMRRLTPPCYDDGTNAQRGSLFNILPSARLISNELFAINPMHDQILNPVCINDLASHFGQFMNHDKHSSAGSEASDIIDVPEHDQWLEYPGHVSFNRGAFTYPDGPVRQQITQVSGISDLSVVYGNQWNELEPLVDVNSGKFILEKFDGGWFPPTDSIFGLNLLKTGDGIRASQHNGLLSLHVLAVRTHNYWVREFGQARGSLNKGRKFTAGEKFHLARRMTIGVFQKAFIEEWIPAMTGVIPPAYRGYNDTCDPSPSNEVMAVAFRLGHSGTREFLFRYDKNFEPLESEGVPFEQTLVESAFSPEQMYNNTGGIEAFIRGSLKTQAGRFDLNIVDSIRNLLIFNPATDLAATDVQRARDHGICSYSELRTALNLSAVESFDDLNTAYAEARWKISQVYPNVTDVDAIVGLLQEDPANENSAVGETFVELMLTDLVDRMMHCDRFYWENADIYTGFVDPSREVDPLELIDAIAEYTFSDVLRKNSDITSTQLNKVLNSQENAFLLSEDICVRQPL